MQGYVKPLVRRKPDEIILHIGTNNIRDSTSDPQTLAEGIVNLANQIISSSPSTAEISISGLVTRRDNSTFVTKINNTNKRLKAICISNNWSFIDNSNVNFGVDKIKFNESGFPKVKGFKMAMLNITSLPKHIWTRSVFYLLKKYQYFSFKRDKTRPLYF